MPDYWKDPKTQWHIPKNEVENLELRRELIAATHGSESEQQKVMELCSKSLLYWVNLFAWTYNVKTVNVEGAEVPAETNHVPFITWDVQDDAFSQLCNAVDVGKDVLVDKSRDMGASWICITLATWYWLFAENSQILLVSRVEDLVDRRGDPDTLFWKIDYLLENVPDWMIPCDRNLIERGGDCRTHLQLVNPKNGSTISGQATTGHVGRGGRRTFVLFDEMASMQNADDAWRSAADTTSCRIANSTPIGPGTEFSRLRNQGIITNSPNIITLGYWDHPHKGKGRAWHQDPDGGLTGISGRWFWMTPWFEEQQKRRGDTADIGQNILIDHTTSGDLFFNSTIVTRHIQTFGKPFKRYELQEKRGTYEFVEVEDGRWFLWCDIEDGQPDNETNYVMFADIAHGKGSSNSVLAILDRETGAFVGEFVDPFITPYDFAAESCIAGSTVWSGGQDEAFLGWEVNGPGESWYQEVRRNDYSNVYYQRSTGAKTDKRSRKYGWRSDRRNKRIFLASLSKAMAREEITIPCIDGLKEMLEYVYFEDGSVGPGTMRDERTGARESHGDRVIAYAGCVFLRGEVPQFEHSVSTYAEGTLGDLLNHAEVWESVHE